MLFFSAISLLYIARTENKISVEDDFTTDVRNFIVTNFLDHEKYFYHTIM